MFFADLRNNIPDKFWQPNTIGNVIEDVCSKSVTEAMLDSNCFNGKEFLHTHYSVTPNCTRVILNSLPDGPGPFVYDAHLKQATQVK